MDFKLSLPRGSSGGQVTSPAIPFISSGVVPGDPQAAAEGDTAGTAQALPHKVLHFRAFGIGFYSDFWLPLGSPATLRAVSVILRCSVSIWDACQHSRFPLRFATLLSLPSSLVVWRVVP